jgi:AbrB family looped-hinge helix DNA binding protein
METTLDKFGRVLIPKKLRERLGLEPEDALQLDLEQLIQPGLLHGSV